MLYSAENYHGNANKKREERAAKVKIQEGNFITWGMNNLFSKDIIVPNSSYSKN